MMTDEQNNITDTATPAVDMRGTIQAALEQAASSNPPENAPPGTDSGKTSEGAESEQQQLADALAGDDAPPVDETATEAGDGSETEAEPAGDGEQQTFKDPPSRFNAAERASWERVPNAVRAGIYRAINEMESGLAKRSEQFAPYSEFDQKARASGFQNPADLINEYVRIERAFAQNPIRTIQELCAHHGVDLSALAGQPNGQPVQPAHDPVARQAMERIARLEGHFSQQMQAAQVDTETRLLTEIREFAASRPDFEALRPHMALTIQNGQAKSLQEAYDMVRTQLASAGYVQQSATPALTAHTPAKAHTRRGALHQPNGSHPQQAPPNAKTVSEALAYGFKNANG